MINRVTEGCHFTVEKIDVVVNSIYKVILPLRYMFFFSGGFIYYIYHTLFGFHASLARIVARIQGADPKYLARCTNSRNFALMSIAYQILTGIIPPLRWITYFPAMIFFWMFENLYLIICPVMRLESMMNPVSQPHKEALTCSYKSPTRAIHFLVSFDIIHFIIRFLHGNKEICSLN